MVINKHKLIKDMDVSTKEVLVKKIVLEFTEEDVKELYILA